MERRSYLLALGAAGTAATAGCLGGLFESTPEGVVLSEPDDQLAESEDLAYPAYGESFPTFELPDATGDTIINTGELDTVSVVTTFFASCPAECGILLNQLAGVQAETVVRGFADETSFLAITFDPERDDADHLETNANDVGVDLDVGNWHYLRPETAEEAADVVVDQIGVDYERTDESDRMEGYDFNHMVITWLVNPDGVVERVYRGEYVDSDRVADDIEAVLEEFESES